MSFVDDKRISSCLPLLYSGWNRCGHLYLNLEGSVFSRISMKNFLYLSGSIFEVFRFMVVNSKCIFTVTLLLFVFVFHVDVLIYLFLSGEIVGIQRSRLLARIEAGFESMFCILKALKKLRSTTRFF